MRLIDLFKQYLKDKINLILSKLFSGETSFSARYLSNELVECKWVISRVDKLKVFQKGVSSLGIRIFDITLGNSKESSTCIMKEVTVSRKINNCLFKSPVKTGLVLLEIGYRKPNYDWDMLCTFLLKLGERTETTNYSDDSWFYLPSPNSNESLHQKMYRLSKGYSSGGSEKIHSLSE